MSEGNLPAQYDLSAFADGLAGRRQYSGAFAPLLEELKGKIQAGLEKAHSGAVDRILDEKRQSLAEETMQFCEELRDEIEAHQIAVVDGMRGHVMTLTQTAARALKGRISQEEISGINLKGNETLERTVQAAGDEYAEEIKSLATRILEKYNKGQEDLESAAESLRQLRPSDAEAGRHLSDEEFHAKTQLEVVRDQAMTDISELGRQLTDEVKANFGTKTALPALEDASVPEHNRLTHRAGQNGAAVVNGQKSEHAQLSRSQRGMGAMTEPEEDIVHYFGSELRDLAEEMNAAIEFSESVDHKYNRCVISAGEEDKKLTILIELPKLIGMGGTRPTAAVLRINDTAQPIESAAAKNHEKVAEEILVTIREAAIKYLPSRPLDLGHTEREPGAAITAG